jgi:hypothetical protein
MVLKIKRPAKLLTALHDAEFSGLLDPVDGVAHQHSRAR